MHDNSRIPTDVPVGEAGLPRCQTCRRVLLDGTTTAMKEHGDIGDWTSLELVCAGCGAGKKGLEMLRCDFPGCLVQGPAVEVAFGYALCKACPT